MENLRAEVEVFTAAAVWVRELVESLPDSSWSGPGIGEWDLRALVGHTSRALLTVEQYSASPPATEDVASPEAYFGRIASLPNTSPDAVLQRGIEAGETLGQNPATMFGEIVDRVSVLLTGTQDRLVSTIVGGMLLSNYLPTRTFELVVHGIDIARAAHLPYDPPEAPLRRALELAIDLSTQMGEGEELLLAITGRERLRPGFSVLG